VGHAQRQLDDQHTTQVSVYDASGSDYDATTRFSA